MTQQEMIEQIQEVYPKAGETKIRLMLNRAMEDFVQKAKLLSGYGTLDLVTDQRYYAFSDLSSVTSDEDVMEVIRVDYDNVPVDRFIGTVEDSDPDEG